MGPSTERAERADFRAVICTIGHATRSLEELAGVLRAHEVVHLVDVRTIPRSRTNPQFNADVIGASLAAYGVEYGRIAELGGLRGKAKAPVAVDNSAWENASFRNYADYATTPVFARGLEQLLRAADDAAARNGRVAVMCAEMVWWRCHRRIIADHLLARGVPVLHLFDERKAEPAKLSEHARVLGTRVSYPSLAP